MEDVVYELLATPGVAPADERDHRYGGLRHDRQPSLWSACVRCRRRSRQLHLRDTAQGEARAHVSRAGPALALLQQRPLEHRAARLRVVRWRIAQGWWLRRV